MSKEKTTEQTYNFVISYIKDYGYPPTVREICNHFNFDSTSTAFYHLKKLEKQGKIKRENLKTRSIEIMDKSFTSIQLPVLGTIAAGTPILAEENCSEQITVSENLFNGTNLFVLKIKGDSMVNVGIYDQDYVVVSKQNVANNGEIVACLLGNEATVKRYYKENGFFRLQPENSFMKPIFTRDLKILGKVVGLIRNKI